MAASSSAPAGHPPARRRTFWLLFAAAALAGAAFRLVQYQAARSLWLDEAMLALNVAARSYRALLERLDYHQVAPPLFLWIERLAVDAAGVGERALRAWPMAAGIAVPPLLGLVCHRLLGPAGALPAVALAAFSPTLVRYANEAKPYGSDAFATVALVGLAVLVRDRPEESRRWLALLFGGVLALLLSIPAAFVCAAVLAALSLRAGGGRTAWLAGCAAAWAGSLGAVYLTLYGPAARNPYQQLGYEQAFLVPGPGFRERLVLAASGTVWPSFAGDGSGIPALPVWALAATVIVLLGGVWWIARRGGLAGAMLVALPLAFAAAASALRRYPLGVPRMMVFAAPLLIAMAAGAAAALATALSRRVRPALLLAAGAAALTPMVRARVLEAREPFRGEDARALVGVYQERPVRGEPVYVGARGLPSWVFYTTNWSRPDRARLDFYARAATEGPSFENAPPRRFPIVQEGDELVYTYRGRRELLGLSTGRHWRWPRYVSPEVDEGWATNEARRIAGAADPCIWLYFTRMSERAYRPVTWHLREHYQGRIEAMTTVPGGVLTRYCFPRTPAQLEALLRWKASLAPPAP